MLNESTLDGKSVHGALLHGLQRAKGRPAVLGTDLVGMALDRGLEEVPFL